MIDKVLTFDHKLGTFKNHSFMEWIQFILINILKNNPTKIYISQDWAFLLYKIIVYKMLQNSVDKSMKIFIFNF